MQNCSFTGNLSASFRWLLLVVGLLLIDSCEPKKLSNVKEIADEVERRVVKRITGPMIIQETQRVGDSIIRAADTHMHAYLQATLDSGNFKEALQYRQLNNYTPVTTLAQKYQASIGRTGQIWVNPATDPISLLLQEQIKKYSILNKQKKLLQAEVIRVGQTELLYTKPILVTDSRCLHCHGEPTKNLTAENQRALPTDFIPKQTNFKTASWIGMWYVQFKTKGILDSITQKRKKSRRGQPLLNRNDSIKSN